MQNVYAFVPSPAPLSTLQNAPIYKIMEKLNAGDKLNTGRDNGFDGFKHKDKNGQYCTRIGYNMQDNDYCCFDEVWHPEAYKNGVYKLMGYVFDFRPHFKKYLVKWKYYGWKEHYAPNKMFIRNNAANKSHILKIIEMEANIIN